VCRRLRVLRLLKRLEKLFTGTEQHLHEHGPVYLTGFFDRGLISVRR